MKLFKKVLFLSMVIVLCLWAVVMAAQKEQRHDVIVVGAGIAGLSAAWELSQKNFDIAVIEMSPTYGGTGLMSEGALCIVGTPEQEQAGEPDNPRMAYADFMKAGHEMAQATGARLTNMHYQLNYPTGLKRPSDPSGNRGLNAYCDMSIWVNKTGKRFMKSTIRSALISSSRRQPSVSWPRLRDFLPRHWRRPCAAGTRW